MPQYSTSSVTTPVVPQPFRVCPTCGEAKPWREFLSRNWACRSCYTARLAMRSARMRGDGDQVQTVGPSQVTIAAGPADALFLSWLAGFVDGEGCFHVRRSRNRSGSVHYQPGIVIANTDLPALQTIQSTLEIGHVYVIAHVGSGHGKIPNRRNCYQYQVNGIDATRLASSLIPFLRVKAGHARILATFPFIWGYNQHRQRPQELVDEQTRIYEDLRTLSLSSYGRDETESDSKVDAVSTSAT